MSIKFASLIFPNARRVINVSDLALGINRIKRISEETQTPYVMIKR